MLCAALAGSVAVAMMYERNLQRERARADALAERLLELEPLERSDGITDADRKIRVGASPNAYVNVPQSNKSPVEQSTLIDAQEQPKPVQEYLGTLRTRQQVERLQSALVSGTPLQDYQIRALIPAIDNARSEVEEQRAESGARRHEAALASDAETNERIIQAAADILFESQLEVLIQLLDREETRGEGADGR